MKVYYKTDNPENLKNILKEDFEKHNISIDEYFSKNLKKESDGFYYLFRNF